MGFFAFVLYFGPYDDIDYILVVINPEFAVAIYCKFRVKVGVLISLNQHF